MNKLFHCCSFYIPAIIRSNLLDSLIHQKLQSNKLPMIYWSDFSPMSLHVLCSEVSIQSTVSVEKPTIQDGIAKLLKPAEKSINKNLEKDIKLFEASGEKSSRLIKIHDALKSIQPTSTDCEQLFSIASSIKTKVRNRMRSEILETLVWLKDYFIKND